MIVKNFLTDTECDKLVEEAVKNNAWEPQNKDTGIFIYKSKNHSLLIDTYKKISSLFSESLHVQMIRMIHKTDKNSFWQLHSDDEGGKEIKYGVVVYLNDDFSGGELYYPNTGIIIKPEKGMLVYHSGNEKHEVLKVQTGNRYTLTSFVRELTE